jgi:flagellin-like hook-associated protein FlgL
MITQTVTNSFQAELLEGVHDFNTDTFKIALYLATADLDANTTVYVTGGETSGTGYTAGGEVMTGISVNAAGFVNFTNVSWNPAAFTARGALIYNSTKSNKAVAVLDFGSDKTATNTFLVQMPANTATSALIRFS